MSKVLERRAGDSVEFGVLNPSHPLCRKNIIVVKNLVWLFLMICVMLVPSRAENSIE